MSIALEHHDTKATIVPERGAIVSELRVGGRDVLYLDRATLEDPTKNVRGGIPLLFPFAGKLAGDAFVPAGTTIGQHGFGRKKPWTVLEQRPDLLRLALAQDADTRARFPFDYEVESTVRLLARGLEVELLVRATGPRAVPLAPGWHPYFRCPAALKAEVSGDLLPAGRLADDREIDFGLVAPVEGRARFHLPGLGALSLEFAPEMRHLQFWTLPGRDFVCIEPFLGPENTINTPARLEVPPGEARALWLRVEALGS